MKVKNKSGCFKGCVIGCGIIALISVLVSISIAWWINTGVKDITTTSAQELQRNGYDAGGEDIANKGVIDLFGNLSTSINIDQPQNKNVYYLGETLTIDADCTNNVLFVGINCIVNKPISGVLIFYGIGGENSTLTIADNVTIKKVYTNKDVKIVGNEKNIKEGFSDKFNEVLNLSELEKTLREKLGSLYHLFVIKKD